MVEKLQICVKTPNRFDHVIGLSTAAKAFCKNVEIFFTGEGVHATQDPRFSQLLEFARISVCEQSYISRGYKKEQLSFLADKDFVTQIRNSDKVEDCEGYIIL
jgi:DsrE/DsrF-like family